MTDRQETIADIIAWLRKPREGENAYFTLWRDEIADRLEAAHRREREMTKPAGIVNSGAASDTAGNCAKLREALETMNNLFERGVICTSYANSAEEMEQIEELYRKTKSALDAPPRNCDVGTVKQQGDRFTKYCESEVCQRKRCKSQVKALCIERCALAWAQMPYEADEKGGAE